MKRTLPIPLMAGIAALPPLSIDMYLPAIPGMADDFGVEISVIQYSISIFLVSFGAGMLLFGPLSDRYGRRPLALFGLAGFGLSSLLLALSPTAPLFLLCRFFQGLLGSAATVVIPAMIRDTYGKDTARGMSSVTMIMLIAPLVAPIGGSLMLRFWDWRSIFFFLALYPATILVLAAKMLPETRPDNDPGAPSPSFLDNYRLILSRRDIYPDLATFMLSALAFFTYLTAVPFVYISWFGVSETEFGILFAASAGALILANFINVRIVSRIGSRNMVLYGLKTGILFSIVLVLISLSGLSVYWTVACLFIIVGSLGIISVNTDALVLIEFPNQASSTSAVIRTLRFGTGALVGPILAVIFNGTPVPIAALILIAISAAGCVQVIAMKRMSRKE